MKRTHLHDFQGIFITGCFSFFTNGSTVQKWAIMWSVQAFILSNIYDQTQKRKRRSKSIHMEYLKKMLCCSLKSHEMTTSLNYRNCDCEIFQHCSKAFITKKVQAVNGHNNIQSNCDYPDTVGLG